MAVVLSPDHELATKAFLDALSESGVSCVSRATAIKFLLARKFDVSRAHALWKQHEATRRREGLIKFDPFEDPLKTELETGKFTILPTRDATGAAIAVFTAHKHHPTQTTHQTTLQGLVYQLDVALESIETQQAGLVFIYDMTDSKYTNFDYELSQKILTMLKGGYPAKLKKVLIVTAPLWFKAPFRILRLFVREKLRERVHTVSAPQLSVHAPRASLPIHLGGLLHVDHNAWLEHCRNSYTNNLQNSKLDEYVISNHISANKQQNGVVGCEMSDDTRLESDMHITGDTPVYADIRNSYNGDTNSMKRHANSDDEDLDSSSRSWSPGSGCGSGGGTGVTPGALATWVRGAGRRGLAHEYDLIRARPPQGTFTHAKLPSNLAKNRYTDVLCYDHTRVILSQNDPDDPTSDYINANFVDGYKQKNAFIATQERHSRLSLTDPDDPTSDYINANFIDGYKQKNAFIATQGPLPKTFGDFWRMVWEQQCVVIVMTTKAIERGRVKCGQYWPPQRGDSQTHQQFAVTTNSVDDHEHYVITNITLTHIPSGVSRAVWHGQYVRWPDYGVPGGGSAQVLHFLRAVRDAQDAATTLLGDKWVGHSKGPPIIVHCSAGIGRTGTFLTLDICIQRLNAEGVVDIKGTVEQIRAQRAHSIQMPDQFVFCHLAILEYAVMQGYLESADLAGFDEDNDSESE